MQAREFLRLPSKTSFEGCPSWGTWIAHKFGTTKNHYTKCAQCISESEPCLTGLVILSKLNEECEQCLKKQ